MNLNTLKRYNNIIIYYSDHNENNVFTLKIYKTRYFYNEFIFKNNYVFNNKMYRCFICKNNHIELNNTLLKVDNINIMDMQKYSISFVIKLNSTDNKNSDYNAYCYGNGVKSNRILDGFNQPSLKYSLRASGVIEDYEQQVKESSLTYSGLYRWDSSINRLNEFNLSTANFKNLDKNFGSVQKLYARTTDLLVLHQDKITSVLYGKNLLVDVIISVVSFPTRY